jgi:hypothetical protein
MGERELDAKRAMTSQLLHKKLRRQAVEPARVFQMSDWSDERQPLLAVPLLGEKWYGPSSAPYMFKGGDCPVLARALDKWGSEEVRWYEAVLNSHAYMAAEEVTLQAATIFTYPPVPQYWNREREVPVIPVDGRREFLPATAVYYAERRFSKEGAWHRHTILQRVFRYEVRGEPVAVIGTLCPPPAVVLEEEAPWPDTLTTALEKTS